MKRNKQLFFLRLGICLLLIVTATSFMKLTSDDEKGIQFFTGTWKETVEKAQKENKPIFLDVYATWCGPCKLLKKNTFTNKDVADFYNQKFINLSLDGEKGEGAQIAAQLGVSAYPTLFFFDKNGKPVLYSLGYHPPKELIAAGKAALQSLK